jgi:hypothetical protein
MGQVLDCLVSYFGLAEDDRPGFRRYFCYHIIAGHGPTAESGVATITVLAVYDQSQRCTYCEDAHMVETGGPAAAIAAAIRYLDSYHERDHLRRVQSDIRGLDGDRLAVVRHSRGAGNDRNGTIDASGFSPAISGSGGASPTL